MVKYVLRDQREGYKDTKLNIWLHFIRNARLKSIRRFEGY